MLHPFNILPALADIQVKTGFHIEPAINRWVLIIGILAVVVMIYYLYSAQRQVASARIVGWLTVIRIALILSLGLLLLRPMLTLHQTEKASETLWVLLDQSLSMDQKDAQASQLEHLRWADALGLLPAETRPSKLDQSAARLSTLHDDLLQLQTQNHSGADEKESTQLLADFVTSLKTWGENLSDTTARLEKDAKVQTGDAVSITRELRAAAEQFNAAVAQAADQKTPGEIAAVIPWAKTGSSIQSALMKLNPLAAQVDAEFLTQHGADPAVRDALSKIGQMRRADIAYEALTAKAHELPKGMADVLDHQTTHVITFAGTQQIVAFANKNEIPKAIKAGVEPLGTSTDLTGALKFVGDQITQNEHASVLIVTDGRVNEGGDPSIAAQRLASRGVRVFALGVGSRQVAPDASVDYVDAPEWVYKDDTLKAAALIRLDGLSGQPVKIEFLRGNAVIDTHTFTPTDDHVTDVENFKDKPPEAGVYGYSIRVQEMPKEVVKTNNVQEFRVMVKDDKLHVILVQDQPRWEDRYLANYLKRDNRVQLQQVLMEPAHISDIKPPDPVKASPTNKADMAQLLPATAEEWAAFDLIVLGDVPPNILTSEIQANIAKAVRDRGTALLVIAGQLNMPARYSATPLEELLPVHLTSNWTVNTLGDQLKHGFKAEVAPEGANTVFSQLDIVDEKKNADYWSAMGSEDNRWYWHSEQTQAKQSASVFWQIGDLRQNKSADSDALTSARQRALLAAMPVGLGRVLYLASPETWRMRQVNGANLHEKFWGQVVRWVVQNDMPAGGKFVRFGAKNHTIAGSPVVVSIRVLKDDFTPRTGEKFKVVARAVTQKDATRGTVQGGPIIASADAVEIPESPGVYRATMSGLHPGGIELSLQGATVEKLLADDPVATQKSLLVDILSGTDVEMRNVNPDFANLSRIAQAGGGVASDVGYAEILSQRIPDSTHPQESTQRIGLFADPHNQYTKWAHFGFLGLFVALITTEWIVRKAGGLV